jgi:hypothetical protein
MLGIFHIIDFLYLYVSLIEFSAKPCVQQGLEQVCSRSLKLAGYSGFLVRAQFATIRLWQRSVVMYWGICRMPSITWIRVGKDIPHLTNKVFGKPSYSWISFRIDRSESR